MNKKSYKFNYLPFGLPQAPYICQTFMEAIMAWIKENHTRFCWGHMDDLLIGHSDVVKLKKTIRELKHKLKVAKWQINKEKSILTPVKEIVFLGALWGAKGISRLPEAEPKLRDWIKKKPTTDLEQQQKSGFINYYNLFNRKSGSITHKLTEANNIKELNKIIDNKYLHFKKPVPKKKFIVYTDATLRKIGFTIDGIGYDKQKKSTSIIANETYMALTALSFLRKRFKHINYCVELHSDNMATLAFLRRGRTKARWTLKQHLKFYMSLRSLDNQHNTYHYVRSEDNPADFYSRNEAPQFYCHEDSTTNEENIQFNNNHFFWNNFN